jgi:hypothetical protein
MDETQTDVLDPFRGFLSPNYFALDRARHAVIDLVDEVTLTIMERRYVAHWLRMGEVEELEALASLLLKMRNLAT